MFLIFNTLKSHSRSSKSICMQLLIARGSRSDLMSNLDCIISIEEKTLNVPLFSTLPPVHLLLM